MISSFWTGFIFGVFADFAIFILGMVLRAIGPSTTIKVADTLDLTKTFVTLGYLILQPVIFGLIGKYMLLKDGRK